MNNILLPVLLTGVKDMTDRSCRMTFETRELDNREFGDMRDLRGQEGWLCFGLNEIQEEDMPKEDAEVGTKSPSQRLRATLYVLYMQDKKDGITNNTFDVWYTSKIEGIIEAVKKKIK